MAKKSTSPATPIDCIGLFESSVVDKLGKGVLVNASSIVDDPQIVIPVSPSLDIPLGGGIPQGSWVSVCGEPKKGKTTTLLSFAAECQKKGMFVLYCNVEQRLKPKNLKGIAGLSLDPQHFKIVQSTKEKLMTGQDYFQTVETFLHTVPHGLIIFDSISALLDARIADGGLGTETRGAGYKLLTQFIELVQALVPINKSIVCGVTHIIADTSGKSMTGKREKAANRWLYQADVRLAVKWSEAWEVGATKDKDGNKKGGKQIGQIVHWLCQESALSGPGGKCESYIRYGVGIDKPYEIYEMAKACGLVNKSGAWYELTYLANHKDIFDGESPPKLQGDENAYGAIASKPEWLAALTSDVGEFTGTPTEAIQND